jgi:hypothetical protein
MTQARDETQLHEALARSGLHLSFLQKETPDRVGALCRFLFEFGWLADPAFGAYSPALRGEISRLRRYSVARPRLEGGLPQPLLFVAGSGEGKTRSATAAARWLLDVRPSLRPRSAIETLDCNTLERGQGAQIALFGRGPRDRHERQDESGLAARGKAQRAAGGILIVDELGNSSPAFQELLLTFIETGRTQPEWIHDGMTADALGPLDVLFEFTAQPRHIEEGRIKEDLARRYARGTTILIPPLKNRLTDAAGVLFVTVEAWWRGRTAPRGKRPDAAELVLPEVESWLVEAVKEHGLSASAVVDLVGQPENAPLGIPYFEHRLRQVLAPRPSRPQAAGDSGGIPPEDAVRTEAAARPCPDVLDLVELLTGNGAVSFPRNARHLKGMLGPVTAAAARLILAYLEACAEITRAGREQPNVAGTYNLMAGLFDASYDVPVGAGESGALGSRAEGRVGTTVARTRLKDLFFVNPDQTLVEIRRSDLLASLAIHVAGGARSQGLRSLLKQLSEESGQKERLRSLGWSG